MERAAFETRVLPYLRLHAAEPMHDRHRAGALHDGGQALKRSSTHTHPSSSFFSLGTAGAWHDRGRGPKPVITLPSSFHQQPLTALASALCYRELVQVSGFCLYRSLVWFVGVVVGQRQQDYCDGTRESRSRSYRNSHVPLPSPTRQIIDAANFLGLRPLLHLAPRASTSCSRVSTHNTPSLPLPAATDTLPTLHQTPPSTHHHHTTQPPPSTNSAASSPPPVPKHNDAASMMTPDEDDDNDRALRRAYLDEVKAKNAHLFPPIVASSPPGPGPIPSPAGAAGEGEGGTQAAAAVLIAAASSAGGQSGGIGRGDGVSPPQP